jgi:hypothetical protein
MHKQWLDLGGEEYTQTGKSNKTYEKRPYVAESVNLENELNGACFFKLQKKN